MSFRYIDWHRWLKSSLKNDIGEYHGSYDIDIVKPR